MIKLWGTSFIGRSGQHEATDKKVIYLNLLGSVWLGCISPRVRQRKVDISICWTWWTSKDNFYSCYREGHYASDSLGSERTLINEKLPLFVWEDLKCQPRIYSGVRLGCYTNARMEDGGKVLPDDLRCRKDVVTHPDLHSERKRQR